MRSKKMKKPLIVLSTLALSLSLATSVASADPGAPGQQGLSQNGQNGDQGDKQDGQSGDQGQMEAGQSGDPGQMEAGQSGDQGAKQDGQSGEQGPDGELGNVSVLVASVRAS